MLVKHHNCKKEVIAPSFLLTNPRGGFVFLAAGTTSSRFQGCHFMDGWAVFKAIETIAPRGLVPDELEYGLGYIRRKSGACIETFRMGHDDALLYEIEGFNGFLDIALDCRELYDHSDVGRIYGMEKTGDSLIFKYTKFSDASLKAERYSMFVVVKGVAGFETKPEWVKREYPFDKARESWPYEGYVYNAASLEVQGSARFVFSYSQTFRKAVEHAVRGWRHFDAIAKAKTSYLESLAYSDMRSSPELKDAFSASVASLDSFIINKSGSIGLLAGYPWYAQLWSRDEALSCGAMLAEHRLDDYMKIFFRQLEHIGKNGRLPNRFPGTELGSSDATGWFWHRFHMFLKILERDGGISKAFGQKELDMIRKKLRSSLGEALGKYTSGGLAVGGPLETWMDTGYMEDTRAGARIELQALRLSMLELMVKLCHLLGDTSKAGAYRELEHMVARTVRHVFWHKPLLYDGSDDPTVRPNIFLAYYAYPELLSRRDWAACFEHALDKLYLPWGGLATIDKGHKYFVDHYTGQANRSYHRGDSWYFLNNIAAICLLRVDKKFVPFAEKILHAGAEDLLFGGVIGYQSELSSARERKSEGSLAQCWSSATFIELIQEFRLLHPHSLLLPLC